MRWRRRSAGPSGPRSGGAMVISLVTVTVVASLGGAYLQMVTSTSSRQSGETATLKAFYIAEAGLAESFHSVRMGRSGQVASMSAPAKFGGGLVWVDASQTEDDQIRLVSTGMWAGGRATLSYVLEPQELTLGIFSDQGMEIDGVLMVDGYDSGLGSYASQLEKEQGLPAGMPPALEEFLFAACPVGDGTNGCHMGYHGGCVGEWSHAAVYENLMGGGGSGSNGNGNSKDKKDKKDETGSASGGAGTSQEQPTSEDYDAFLVERDADLGPYIESLRAHADLLYGSYVQEALAGNQPSGESLYPRPGIGRHMESGGLLASNGSIQFDPDNTQLQEIYGDIVTGPEGDLGGIEGIVLTGEHRPRGLSVELPEVNVPDLPMQGPVRQESVLPMLIPSGMSGLESVEVAADSELIVQGPATVVLGGLTLEPGARMTLDTRGGDVALYLTGALQLMPGSETVTTGENPSEMSLQVAAIEAFPGETPVRLESSSQFQGTIFSPGTDVYVGSDFEVFGGVVSRRITFGAGSRLHVDQAKYGGSPVPKVVSWRILELPDGDRSVNINPYTFVGLSMDDAPELSAAADLEQVVMDIEYLDNSGTPASFSGFESAFDWSNVQSVVQVQRSAFRELEPGATAMTVTDKAGNEIAAPAGARQSVEVVAAWASAARAEGKDDKDVSKYVEKSLRDKVPFSADDWTVILGIESMTSNYLDKLSKGDVKAGGAGI